MSFNVTDFNNQYTGDYARGNLFEVTILNLAGTGENDVKLFVKGGSLPEAKVAAIAVPYQNRKLQVPGDRTFADWQATVMQDEGYVLRTALLNWQAAITGFTSFTSTAGVSASHKEIVIQPFNRDGSPSGHKARVYGWPSTIGAVALSWDDADKIQEYTVDFTISWDDGGIDASDVHVLS